MIDNELLPKLLQNLLEILNDDKYYDVKIEVGSEPYVKIFRAHTVILYYRSPYLKKILSEKNDGVLTHIKLPNILPEIFKIILRYIYGGRISLEEHDTLDIIKILVAASELSLQELVSYIQSFLIENKASWMEQNFEFIYKTCFKNDSFLELQKYCIESVSKDSDKIFKSLDLSSIPERLLVSIIRDGNHQMSEIQVWEYVLKWGLAQNPELPSEITNYSKDDFDTLRNTLQQFIPLIRFYSLTSKEFLGKVFPYEEVFPKELYKGLLKTFLSLSNPNSKPNDEPKPSKTHITKEKLSDEPKPSKIQEKPSDEPKPSITQEKPSDEPNPSITQEKPSDEPKPSITQEKPSDEPNPSITKEIKSRTIDSKIIKYQHAELILKWVDRLEIMDELISSYDFKLLFRASRDGFDRYKFHQICDDQSRTVTIIKVEESNEILGGYNPIEWKSDGNFEFTRNSFIFSFKNNDRIEDHILSRVIDANSAIVNDYYFGPSFGISDLIIWRLGDNRSCKTSYEKPIRNITGIFSVEELEVFQIK